MIEKGHYAKMVFMIEKETLNYANQVCNFLMDLSEKYPERWNAIGDCSVIPYGDLAYGEALADWNKRKDPRDYFSYAEGEEPCPYLMEFRKEISEKFGLRILTAEEAAKETSKVMVTNVFDWGVSNSDMRKVLN